MQSRVAAALILKSVIQDGRSLSTALPSLMSRLANPAERSFVQELCYGVLRWKSRLDAMAALLLAKPLRRKDTDVYCLVLIGLYQLSYMRIAEHAAVAETVGATRALKKTWSTGLVNAVLRAYQRDRASTTERVDADYTARLAHPSWMLERFRASWPADWEAIIAANNERPPMVLRVNRRKIPRNDYLIQLQEAGYSGQPLAHCPDGIRLEQPVDVERLPGFAIGAVSVQDGGAQLAVELLDLQPGQRILDACAAPGGKACHILERQPGISELVAVDKDPHRLERVRDNLSRLDLAASVVCGDATVPESWWDGVQFDRILLDAPCSATGVIRRHPDIKTLRTSQDIARLNKAQALMLNQLWPLLKSGGMLLYATCSILPEENHSPVAAFLTCHHDARTRSTHHDWARSTGIGVQILPGQNGMDGFYYACIEKR